jgi:c-di-GMP-binding flagellar brake protein YcgR
MATPSLTFAHLEGLSDRRENRRFPLSEEVRYSVTHHKSLAVQGAGKTLNASSGGILFTTEGALPMGQRVELFVNWPARLGGACPLQLIVIGRVVRTDGGQAAVRIERYQFKTRRLLV